MRLGSEAAGRPSGRAEEQSSGPALDITHLMEPGQAGGLEQVVEMLAVGHAALGHRVNAVAILHEGNARPPIIDRLIQGGVPVSVVMTSGRSYRAEREMVRAVLEARERGILHSHGYRADVLHLATGARLGYATVTTLHGFTGGDVKNRIYEFFQRRACRRADRVVAVSQPIAQRMLKAGVRADHLRTVRNAYAPAGTLVSRADARSRLGLSPSEWVVAFVGRLSAEKGADILLDAMTNLRDLPIVAAIVGDGREASALREKSKALGLDSMVHWVGAVDQAGSLFSAFDVFALSSRTEGTPIALFEAMHARVPIVAAAVGGVPDVLTTNEAIMVPSNSPAALAAGIRSVFTDRASAAARTHRAAERLAVEFAPGPWLHRYEDIYAEAMARQPVNPKVAR
jgi:glycosyltransferase involved in cell wall biosynthesis